MSKNVVKHLSKVLPSQRYKIMGQVPRTLWFTGLSASGKSTLAYALESALIQKGRPCFVLDGDNVRHGLNNDLGFTSESRSENIRRVAEVARLMNEAGLIVITALISPLVSDREMAANIIGDEYFDEIYVSTNMSVCESRDPKGLYRKARLGDIKNFTGVSAPYEAPHHPLLTIDTSFSDLETHVGQLVYLALRLA
jgi:adenylyl-sulfate kinase